MGAAMAKDDDHGPESIWTKPLASKRPLKAGQNQGVVEPPDREPKPDPPDHHGPHPEASQQRGSVLLFPVKKYLDPGVNIKTMPLPLVRFPGVKRVIPEWEKACNGWMEFCA